jgi:hypothetical protein
MFKRQGMPTIATQVSLKRFANFLPNPRRKVSSYLQEQDLEKLAH